MSLNPRGALRPICHDHESDPDQEEDPPSGHGPRCYPYFSSHSLRRAARALRPIIRATPRRGGGCRGSAPSSDPSTPILGKCVAYSSMRRWWTWEGPRVDMGRVRARPPCDARLPRELARELHRCLSVHREARPQVRRGPHLHRWRPMVRRRMQVGGRRARGLRSPPEGT
jgi:hypothetical protein